MSATPTKALATRARAFVAHDFFFRLADEVFSDITPPANANKEATGIHIHHFICITLHSLCESTNIMHDWAQCIIAGKTHMICLHYITHWRMNNMANNNQYVTQNAGSALDQMKYEIASEFGVQLGPDTSSRQNGSVGGEITKRLVAYAEQHLAGGFRR
jgi:small acid-soluble spore protein B (major beta-type SASP)